MYDAPVFAQIDLEQEAPSDEEIASLRMLLTPSDAKAAKTLGEEIETVIAARIEPKISATDRKAAKVMGITPIHACSIRLLKEQGKI